MSRINSLTSSGAANVCAVEESKQSMAQQWTQSSMRQDSADIRHSVRSRAWALPAFFLTTLAALWTATAAAQTRTIYLTPLFLWNITNVQDCGGCSGPLEYYTNLQDAWTLARLVVDGTRDGSTYTAENLIATPGVVQFDDIPSQNEFGVEICNSGGCNYAPNTGYIQTGTVCPAGTSMGNYGTLSPSPTNELIACALTISSTEPPPKKCLTCLGNPIYAGTGQK